MIAYIKIKDYTNEKAFCLPVNYIQSNQDGQFIYVAKQSSNVWIAEPKIVKTGWITMELSKFLKGFRPGEKIITSGFQNLNAGEKVEF